MGWGTKEQHAMTWVQRAALGTMVAVGYMGCCAVP